MAKSAKSSKPTIVLTPKTKGKITLTPKVPKPAKWVSGKYV